MLIVSVRIANMLSNMLSKYMPIKFAMNTGTVKIMYYLTQLK